jgi:hypothetical protein
MVEDLATQLHRLATTPEARQSLGSQARLRMENNFRWDSKGEFLHRLIREHEGARLSSH